MKTKLKQFLLPVIYGILAAIVLLLPGQLSNPANAQTTGAECWAVIVGVSDYQNLADLDYADDDARDLADQLSPVWGSDHINLLINSAATKQGIENAVTGWLASREDANDVVLFYWSGYFSSISGYLFTHDSLTSSWANDIQADELDGWLNGLDSKKIVVMGVGGGVNYDVLAGNGRIIMVQSTADEDSWSVTDLGHGAFTYYILEALKDFEAADSNNNLELSVEELFNYAKTRTTDYTSSHTGLSTQHPQMSDGYQGELALLIKVTADIEINIKTASSILTIDEKTYLSSVLPQSFIWAPGSSHSIQAASEVSGETGTRYVFTSWDDGNTSSSRTITNGGLYRADYKTQYYLTVNSLYGNPGGAGWYDSSSTAAISVISPVEQAGTKRIFTEWSGDYSGNAASAAVIMNQPKTVTAGWKTQYYLTVTSVYGIPEGAGWYDSGSTAGISIAALVEETGTRHYFAEWSGDYSGDAASASVIMNQPKTVTAAWRTDYLLTLVSEYGDAQGGGWYNSGAAAAISVTSPVGMIVRKVFNGWSGDYSGDTAGALVIMNQPKTVTANWKTDFLQLYILIIIIVLILGGLGFWFIKIRKRKAPVVLSEAAPLLPSPKRCANCGAEIEPGDAFCIKCGKPVKDN